ncbi:hypothetical protein CJF32_00005275 [Rutstroemia sp. NJR-2017a WRK4]|nr:hypothetical protein CJF32_00005275 [Rutstroemia sp. NJR-2017a WRK4]
MPCYCANYYGSLNCQNAVPNFGDRCALCVATQAPTTNTVNLTSASQQWIENNRREQLRRDEANLRMERMNRTVVR